MKQKTIQLKCSTSVKNILCEAVRNYAHLSYPETQKKEKNIPKQDLLNTISHIEDAFSRDPKYVVINKDFYNDYQAAINHHYDRIHHELNANVDEQRKLMLNLLNGHPAQDYELDQALYRDEVI